MRKRFFAAVAALVMAGLPLSALAQDYGAVGSEDEEVADVEGEDEEDMPDLKPWEAHPEDYVLVDTVMYVRAEVLDSSLFGRDVFELLSESGGQGGVRVSQSGDIQEVMEAHFEANKDRGLSGYRVRIFFDNKRTARGDSEAAMEKFKALYPEVEVFRSYVNPYFKVTVGNYRTRSEAMGLLRRVRREFPTAFIVKEEIEYPAIVSGREMVLDSVSFYRYIGVPKEISALYPEGSSEDSSEEVSEEEM